MIIIGIQIALVLLDIVLMLKQKNTTLTHCARAIIYFLQGDMVALALIFADVGQGILYEQRKELEHGKIITYMMVISIILLIAKMGIQPIHFLLMVGIIGSLHYSYKDNKKSSHSHFAWLVYNVHTKNYILVIDDLLYGIRSVINGAKEDFEKEELQKIDNNM